jgi:hypothetical protein
MFAALDSRSFPSATALSNAAISSIIDRTFPAQLCDCKSGSLSQLF